jgi:hypothetical protein
MDSPRTRHVIFTGFCYVLSAILGAIVTYFLTVHFTSDQNNRDKTVVEEKATTARSSVPPGRESTVSDLPSFAAERLSFQKQITELQAALAEERREKEGVEQKVAGLEAGRSTQKEKINKLELNLSEVQSKLDGANSRLAALDVQLKKFSEDSQKRLDRARTNFKAGRVKTLPAPDGSGRSLTVVYDERGADVVSPTMIARFRAGE